MIRILITGAAGQLGQSLKFIAEGNKSFELILTDINELDITNAPEVIQFIKKSRPAYLVNCAAYTAVDKAESDQEKCRLLNARAPMILAEGCQVSGTRLIHISTDFVFDGRKKTPYLEEDKTAPLSVYGASKREGEQSIENQPLVMIVRTSWLYSEFGSNFFKTILRLSAGENPLRIVQDQTGTPTYAGDLAAELLNLITRIENKSLDFIPGIFHYSNEGETNWYEFAVEILRQSGIPKEVIPITTEEYPVPAKRPAYSVLSKDKIARVYGIRPAHWQDALSRCIQFYKTIHSHGKQ